MTYSNVGKVGNVLPHVTGEPVDTTALADGSVVPDPYDRPDQLRRLDSARMIWTVTRDVCRERAEDQELEAWTDP